MPTPDGTHLAIRGMEATLANVSAQPTAASPAKVLLSTSSVYPETTASGFELAAALGYDGVELMVGIDPVAADIDAVEKLRDFHGVPVQAIHAPCLLVTQRTWGDDPWEKLAMSAKAATRLGADTVVVHPPFRWQGTYASGFEAGIRRLNDDTGIQFCVENMYPWRTPVRNFKAYLPSWDPSDLDYDYLTLDLSHASTAKVQSLDLARSWGSRLRHLHLTDGSGSVMDEHLLPGQGDQRADEVLAHLVEGGFDGHVVLEVNTRSIGSRGAREHALADALSFTRTHLGQLAGAATS